MARSRGTIKTENARDLGESGKDASYFGMCAADRERLMRMRRERSLLFVYPDEWTTPSAIEIASWED